MNYQKLSSHKKIYQKVYFGLIFYKTPAPLLAFPPLNLHIFKTRALCGSGSGINFNSINPKRRAVFDVITIQEINQK